MEHALLVRLLFEGALGVGKFAPFLLLLVNRADLLADDRCQVEVLLDRGHILAHPPAHLGRKGEEFRSRWGGGCGRQNRLLVIVLVGGPGLLACPLVLSLGLVLGVGEHH